MRITPVIKALFSIMYEVVLIVPFYGTHGDGNQVTGPGCNKTYNIYNKIATFLFVFCIGGSPIIATAAQWRVQTPIVRIWWSHHTRPSRVFCDDNLRYTSLLSGFDCQNTLSPITVPPSGTALPLQGTEPANSLTQFSIIGTYRQSGTVWKFCVVKRR